MNMYAEKTEKNFEGLSVFDLFQGGHYSSNQDQCNKGKMH